MNIFIIGYTKSGKTTLAKHICDLYSFNHIEASCDLKKLYPIENNENLLEYTNRLSSISNELLHKDYNYFNNKIRNSLSKTKVNVISGIRNPVDLFSLVDFNKDIIIYMSQSTESLSDFEKYGIKSISDSLIFIEKFINEKSIINYEMVVGKSIDENFKSNKIKIML